MSTTQEHLLISDIKDDIVILKNGGGALVLQVSAVNFGLLSNREQIAIIASFAQMLNSLNYSLQIVVRSERLNISSYLDLLDKAQKAQTNTLLLKMITSYRQFIQNTIKENEVLDKQFYLVVPLFSLELGLTASKASLEQKIKTILLPRRDQIIRQLQRVGLKTTQLTNQKLIELFFDVYNGLFVENIPLSGNKEAKIDVNLKEPQKPEQLRTTQNNSDIQNVRVSENLTNRPSDIQSPSESFRTSKTHPFVVEELEG